MQKKTDRRVRKTKSQLKTGLAQLMREKSIREITVKELVDAVDINRSTFYLHYSDIPGLLAEVENEMMEEMQRAIREHPIDPGKDTVYYFIQDLFHVLDENRQIASALVGPHGDIGFVHKLEQLLEEKSRESLAALVPEKIRRDELFLFLLPERLSRFCENMVGNRRKGNTGICSRDGLSNGCKFSYSIL